MVKLIALGPMELLIILGVPIAIFIVWVYSLVDILRSEFNDGSTKILWFLVVFFLSLVGVILYFIIGRSQRINKGA